MLGLEVLLAYLLDRLFGDPTWLPHPVVAMGASVSRLEKWLLPAAGGVESHERRNGAVLVGAVVAGTGLAGWGLLRLADLVYPPAQFAVSVLLIATTVASKGLAGAGMEIFRATEAGRLPEAREKLARIVGRDSAGLPEPEVVRGTVETVAENTVDAVVAPLFYALLGGAPLALVYRAINTMDSMLGYRNERYRHFGWAAARLDDLANYVPARLGGIILCLLAPLAGGTWGEAFSVWRRDARAHPSPNSGHPEAAVAGALGVRLGGVNYYQGVANVRPYLGNDGPEIAPAAITAAIRLMSLAGYVTALGGFLLVSL